MRDPIIDRVHAAAQASELLRAAASVRHDGGLRLALGGLPLRRLAREEIEQLLALGNSAEDWSRLRVSERFDPQRVRHSHFQGTVVLGPMHGTVRLADGLELPAGINHCTLANCVIGPDVCLRDVGLLANYVVGAGAVVLDCGSVSCATGATCGNGGVLPVGVEVGGRELAVYAEIDTTVAAAVALRRGEPDLQAAYTRAVQDYVEQARLEHGLIASGACLRGTASIVDTYVGPHGRIDGATRVANSTLLSTADEPAVVEAGACVSDSLLQWGSHVTTLAVVERCVLAEHVHVERHGKVRDSFLGPNCAIGAGEVTACLLGPLVAAHHQSLLIATLWPEGKGNVAHGADVGSNHTGRRPDQEFHAGEGLFLGLGVNVKFPANFREAPYSLIASGVSLPPQKVTFPFSLLTPGGSRIRGLSSALNEIQPGWMLAENLYALKRNEVKFRTRNKARRAELSYSIFRPDILDLVRDALQRLEAVEQPKPFYTEREIPGLGRNFLREVSRHAAIAAYQFAIRYYALLGLKEQIETCWPQESPQAINRLLAVPSAEQPWEHQRQILREELYVGNVVAALGQLPRLLRKVAEEVQRARAKDDERGGRVFEDYGEVHSPAAADDLVRQTWTETRRLQQEVRELLQRWEKEGTLDPDPCWSAFVRDER